MFNPETREDILTKAITKRRLREISLKHFAVYEDGVCVFDGSAHNEKEFEEIYRKRFGVTGEGSYAIEELK